MTRAYAYPPRLMQAPEAARYLGISETKLRSQDIRRRESGGNRLYDIRDLDGYADRLAYEGIEECHTDSTTDAAFGLMPARAA